MGCHSLGKNYIVTGNNNKNNNIIHVVIKEDEF